MTANISTSNGKRRPSPEDYEMQSPSPPLKKHVAEVPFEEISLKREAATRRLQTVWEDIIHRYSQYGGEEDSDGGDVIDLETGTILVDHGHLRGLARTTGAVWGVPAAPRETVFRGVADLDEEDDETQADYDKDDGDDGDNDDLMGSWNQEPPSNDTSQVTGNSVLAGLAVGLGGSLLLFVGFCLVRPHNARVYAPKPAPSPVLSAHPTAWLRRIFAPGDQELADALGLDAVVYLQFVALCRNVFVVGTVLAGAVVVPINIVYNLRAVNSAGAATPARSDYFFLTTPTLLRGAPMGAHVAVTWAIDFVACWFVWTHTARVVALRQRRMRQAARAGTLYMRIVMVTEIPRRYMSDTGLARLVAKAAAFQLSCSAADIVTSIESVWVGRDVTKLAQLAYKHDGIVFRLEKILAKYLRDPDNLPLHRPIYKTAGGAKVDAIDHFFTKLNRVERQLVDAQRAVDANRCLPYGFICFRSAKACHEFARTMEKRRRGHLYPELASRPEDIIWDNIVLTRVERHSKQVWGDFLFVCLVVGWIVPNAFMGTFLSQLSRMGVLWPAFGRFTDAYPVAFSLLQGALSPAVTALVFLILPMLMRRLIQWQGKLLSPLGYSTAVLMTYE
ncbi:hypothetical protein DV451_002811 [Geotrichum candidum]|uniref:CSC1/OSCA1-like cytosolic domain-containing protein n=1 Tax=Geotrichum candidum TaxID=1173061 RepID=A0A9P5G5I9_GEOCN|nr:hypothetical protein DV451_002811 [Geotrichum candidum]